MAKAMSRTGKPERPAPLTDTVIHAAMAVDPEGFLGVRVRDLYERSQITRRIAAALNRIIKADEAFRATLPSGWETDPVTDECRRAKKILIRRYR